MLVEINHRKKEWKSAPPTHPQMKKKKNKKVSMDYWARPAIFKKKKSSYNP